MIYYKLQTRYQIVTLRSRVDMKPYFEMIFIMIWVIFWYVAQMLQQWVQGYFHYMANK